MAVNSWSHYLFAKRYRIHHAFRSQDTIVRISVLAAALNTVWRGFALQIHGPQQYFPIRKLLLVHELSEINIGELSYSYIASRIFLIAMTA